MCGIFGLINRNSKNIADNIIKELSHRGPDDKGIYKDENVVLGHTRLSIIDLSDKAHQPMIEDNENYIIIYNGEIYNYKELKSKLAHFGYHFKTSSDTEVIIKSYKKWGKDCVKYFRGMFAFAIYDKKNTTLFLARNRFGIKPLFYSFYNGNFIFASEVSAIIKSGLIPKKISEEGLVDYHYFGSVQQPNTIFEHVSALMPSSTMCIDIKNLNYQISKYYDYNSDKISNNTIDYNEAVELVRLKLEEATEYHLISDVEVGAFLSGGIDSSLVAVIAADALGCENVTGITMPSRFNTSETRSDAEILARNLRIGFHTIPIGDTLDAFSKMLSVMPGWDEKGLAYENLQARIRGTILMSCSNQFGWLVLTTGNKSETAVGYSTLYGDTAGGFAVIKDVPKTMVYELSEYVNRQAGRELIPRSIITRPPSAELRADQKDSDSLPDYVLLDDILKNYVELDHSVQQILQTGFPEQVVRRVVGLVDRNEYKRRQNPPGVKITPRAFGRDRRMPMTNRYNP